MHTCFSLSVSPMTEILFSSPCFCPPKIFHRTPTTQSQRNKLFLYSSGDVTCQQWNQYFPNVSWFFSSLIHADCSLQCLAMNRKYSILQVTVLPLQIKASLFWLSALSSVQSNTTVGNKGNCMGHVTQILFLHGSLGQNSSSGNMTWSLWYCPPFWRCLSSPCVELNDLCRGYLSL